MARPRRLVLVDDHPIVRQGLAQLINQEPDLLVCGEAEDAAGGLALVERERPDLVLVDLSLRESSGLELIKDLTVRIPCIRILVLSLHDETIYAERALQAGAHGFLMKIAPTAELMIAIRSVLDGLVYVSARMQNRLLRKMAQGKEGMTAPFRSLSDREIEVFQLIGEGRSTREIADQLRLGIKAVETHRAHIKLKLNIDSSNELVRFAVGWSMQENMLHNGEGLRRESTIRSA